ncbi:MAG: radical SAM protein, partial [Anaeromyxobacteraceae bacterium]
SAGAVALLAGECEEDLVALARAAEAGHDLRRFLREGALAATREKLDFPVPSREGLPPPEKYARLADAEGGERLAGHAEASRGCKHLSRHCPIPAQYGGRFYAEPVEVVLDDIARQVARGVEHITFGDPDFLNGPGHALRVAAAVHARFPQLTFDFTAKVEHLVRHGHQLPRLRAEGAIFVVSAIESLSPRVLAKLEKGHDRDDVFRAYAACAAAGIALRPSLLPFTPWSTLDDYLDLLEVFSREGWVRSLDPVQLSIRLLVPPGSLLLGDPELASEGLDAAALTHRWRHPDPRMDALQAKVARAVEDGAARAEPAERTFETVRRLALAAAGRPHDHVVFSAAADTGRRAPRLTESWFC